MLEVTRLTVHHGRSRAVDGVSFAVQAGEIVGVVGPNGAGKSTTLGAICGLFPVTEGAVTFDGERLDGRPPEAIARRGVALVPEGRRIFTTLTVAENLALARPHRRDSGGLAAVLARFPVLERRHRAPAGLLSGGEQQQLAIARALIAEPRILLLDEPSLGLAPAMVDLVFDTLGQLRDDGMTVLVVEQNVRRTLALADRTFVLRGGRIVTGGTREQLDARPDVVDAYFGAEAARAG